MEVRVYADYIVYPQVRLKRYFVSLRLTDDTFTSEPFKTLEEAQAAATRIEIGAHNWANRQSYIREEEG